MAKFWFLFYNFLIIPTLYLLLRFLGLFNSKIRRGIKGRARVLEEIILNAMSLDKTKKLIWVHSSSLGEFEQAKPIIEKLKTEKDANLLVTFFSPSGFENSRKYPHADLVSYLPFDTYSNAKNFLKITRPNLAVMMRYDIWPNYIWRLKRYEIPCIIVDATMRKNSQRKYLLSKSFHKVLYKGITRILTVSQEDSENFKAFGCTDAQLQAVGDTRFDRVYHRSLTARDRNLISDELIKDKKVLVAGSTWEADEEVLIPAFVKLARYDKHALLIIAPHEPTLLHLEKIEHEFSGILKTIRFSYLNEYKDERVIIVDSIGILLTLYYYAHAAFVGGGFKQNIHNVLEAAVYGIPVMFGPKIENSQEARMLVANGAGMIVRNKREAYRSLRTLLSKDSIRSEKGKTAYSYVQENLGATEKILREIYKIV